MEVASIYICPTLYSYLVVSGSLHLSKISVCIHLSISLCHVTLLEIKSSLTCNPVTPQIGVLSFFCVFWLLCLVFLHAAHIEMQQASAKQALDKVGQSARQKLGMWQSLPAEQSCKVGISN